MPDHQPPQADRYRMPFGFGPALGPRRYPDEAKGDPTRTPDRRTASVRFLTDGARIERLLPPGFRLDGEPVVSVDLTHMTNIEWLGGRGYATFGVRFPVRFRGERDEGAGQFLAVLWENRADPIITGREELGFAKLYCELPEPEREGGSWRFQAAWDGTVFATLTLDDLTEDRGPPPAPADLYHYKYVPATGRPGEADAAYATVTPALNPNVVAGQRLAGRGSITFLRRPWKDLPTLHTIVDALADLPVLEPRGASLAYSRGGKDLSDQRRLD